MQIVHRAMEFWKRRPARPRYALALAGGGVIGGMYEVGAMTASTPAAGCTPPGREPDRPLSPQAQPFPGAGPRSVMQPSMGTTRVNAIATAAALDGREQPPVGDLAWPELRIDHVLPRTLEVVHSKPLCPSAASGPTHAASPPLPRVEVSGGTVLGA